MRLFWSPLAKSLRLFPPELAHKIAIFGLKISGPRNSKVTQWLAHNKQLQCRIGHLSLPHPIGLAAGFDKDAEVFSQLARLGFSFVEVGTVTPKPQEGNPKPRIFRLAEQRALINRMGFNNAGAEAMRARLSKHPSHTAILGVNIGKNKSTDAKNALDDYRICYNSLSSFAHYMVINISSPNTPGLRDLAGPSFIRALASVISAEDRKRTWIKLDPDQPRTMFNELIATITDVGFVGVVLTNTHKIEKPEIGGLSGAPIAVRAAAHLENAWQVHQGRLEMISSGGIFSGLDILERVRRGASAVQVYTAFVYMGPLVIQILLQQLQEEMALLGCQSLDEIRGSYYEE